MYIFEVIPDRSSQKLLPLCSIRFMAVEIHWFLPRFWFPLLWSLWEAVGTTFPWWLCPFGLLSTHPQNSFKKGYATTPLDTTISPSILSWLQQGWQFSPWFLFLTASYSLLVSSPHLPTSPSNSDPSQKTRWRAGHQPLPLTSGDSNI